MRTWKIIEIINFMYTYTTNYPDNSTSSPKIMCEVMEIPLNSIIHKITIFLVIEVTWQSGNLSSIYNQYSMDELDQNLNEAIEYAAEHDPSFTVIKQLKFKNTVFAPGMDIVLVQDIATGKETFAKIMAIAKVDHIQFPILLVAWYFTRDDPIVAEHRFSHLARRELVASNYEDWQYVEALKGKITVVSEEAYLYMDIKEREADRLYFCRSYIVTGSPNLLNKLPQAACHCMRPLNPDDVLNTCVVCGVRFHRSCAGNDDLCLTCQ